MEPGPEVAILCATYGYTPDQVAGFTPAQTQYLLASVPEVALRRVYPIVSLEATIRNALGGKKTKKADKPDDGEPFEPWTALELVPWFARPSWLQASTVPRDAAVDFLRNRRRLPPWAITIAPIDEIRRAAA